MTDTKASARVSYAVSLYLETVEKLGARAAYDMAVHMARLDTPSERQAMRDAITATQRR